VHEFEDLFLTTLEGRYPATLAAFKAGKLENDDLAKVKEVAAELTNQFK
jgi:hypothetical protein